jgi:DNA invertase Pin-like site-specific DNA recombinase
MLELPSNPRRPALAIAILADALQIVFFPMFVEGAFSPLDDLLDIAVAPQGRRPRGGAWHRHRRGGICRHQQRACFDVEQGHAADSLQAGRMEPSELAVGRDRNRIIHPEDVAGSYCRRGGLSSARRPTILGGRFMRVALYARVSTCNGQSPEMQLSELREYASRRGWEVYSEYTDLGISGSKESRPELNRLMADAHRRNFDVVLCWKVDRFGRSLKHLVNALADLNAYGVAFVSLRDNLDLSTPSGRLMFQIIGAMAEFERSLIQERVRAGLRNAKLKGKTLGRPATDSERRRDDATARARGEFSRDCKGGGSFTRYGSHAASRMTEFPVTRCHGQVDCFQVARDPGRTLSDVRQEIEVFVILILSTLSFAQLLL